ncbi:hypothetical protein F4777DRAFT_445744 [Nemania sp. FL0916]|nr:hypothetical protein F4777DRAFT_445744 [Nemania sp. FL0916]
MTGVSGSGPASGSGSDAPHPLPAEWSRLALALDSIESKGDFATTKRYQLAPTPILQVDDEIFSLPLNDRDAKTIKELCQQAPFGKGNQTVVDPEIRQTWELGADRFRLTNPAWPAFFEGLLLNVCQNLGITGNVNASLHKLLLYEQGSFFKAHKDSQKAEGMVATLAICLPSKHEGGDVHLCHAGQHRTFNTSDSSLFDTTALAWFSDVTHEVEEVTSGHRLVLTYNIIHKSKPNLSANTFHEQLDTISAALAQCRLHGTGPDFDEKIYPLDHKYSRAGLSLHHLKGRDLAVCESLQSLCSQHEYYLLLAHITRKKSVENPEIYCKDPVRIEHYYELLNAPNGDALAKNIEFSVGQLLRDPYGDDRVEDNFEESEHLGNEESPEIFTYNDTAVVICPKMRLQSFLHLRGYVDVSNIVTMAMQDINENPSTACAEVL